MPKKNQDDGLRYSLFNITSATRKWKQDEARRYYVSVKVSKKQVINFVNKEFNDFPQVKDDIMKQVKEGDHDKDLLLWYIITKPNTTKDKEKTKTK